MKKNLSDYIVALAVIACSVVLLGALTIALTGYQIKKPSRTLQVDYADVTGIHLASELRYAGAPAGRVIGIRYLAANERTSASNIKNAVRVTVAVNENVPPIPSDVEASIGSDTLLSEKFITLTAGTPGKDLLASNAILQGKSGGLDDLFNNAGPAIAKLNDVLTDLQGDLKGIVPKIDDALVAVKGAVSSAQDVFKNVNSLVTKDGTLHQALDKVNDAVAKLKEVEETLDEVLKKASGLVSSTGENLDGRMKELSVVLQNLKVATTYLKSFSQSLAEKPSRLIFSGKSTDLKPEDEILKTNKPVPARSQPKPQP